MQTVVIEYNEFTETTWSPPPLGDFARAASIRATVTSAKGPDTAQISSRALLVDLRDRLEELDFEHHGTSPVRLRTNGRFRPLWREVWTKDEQKEKHMNTWSLQAQKAHRQAQVRQQRREEDRRIMEAGPQLDGHTIIVPSRWYNEEAAAFWRSFGFRWNAADKEWTRDTRQPHGSKVYSANAWLESTYREFFNFWPTLQDEEVYDNGT